MGLALIDVLRPSPRHAEHPGDAEFFLSALVQVDTRDVVEPDDDLERFALAAVLGQSLLDLVDVQRGLVPAVSPADPAIAVARGPIDRGRA
jgi:hypothetical protein